MSTLLRMTAWAWLMAGLLGVVGLIISRMGSAVPLPAGLAASLAAPWSWVLPMMGLTPRLEVVVIAIGIFINAQILFVIANIFGD